MKEELNKKPISKRVEKLEETLKRVDTQVFYGFSHVNDMFTRLENLECQMERLDKDLSYLEKQIEKINKN